MYDGRRCGLLPNEMAAVCKRRFFLAEHVADFKLFTSYIDMFFATENNKGTILSIFSRQENVLRVTRPRNMHCRNLFAII